MSLVQSPNCSENLEFCLKLLCRLKVFDGADSLFSNPANLVATSSKYGLAFVGTPTGLQVLVLSSIVGTELPKGNSDGAVNYPRREIPLPSQPSHLGVSCDQVHLVVAIRRSGCAHAVIYSVPSFTSQNVLVLNEVRLSPSPDVACVELGWNPGIPNMLASCMSDGTASVFEFLPTGVNLNSIPAESRSTCLCWSPKGKQLVIGSSEGTLTQYKPDLKAVKTLPAPPTTGGRLAVVSISWLSSFQFAAVYKDKDNPDEQQRLMVVNTPKGAPMVFVNYDDICYSSGKLRSPQFYLLHQQQWNVLLVGSANSYEMGVLGLGPDQTSWVQWTQDDASRAELPLSADRREAYLLGMTLDYSSTHTIPWGESRIGPYPLLLLLSHHGVLCVYTVVNLRQASVLCSPPEQLADVGGLSLFTSGPAPAPPPAYPTPSPAPPPAYPTPTPAPSLFGLPPASAAPPAGGGLFGAGGGLFGAPQATPVVSTAPGLFASSPAPNLFATANTASTQGLFGGVSAAQTPAFGSLATAQPPAFGSLPPAQPPMFGSLTPAQGPTFGSLAPAQPPSFSSLAPAQAPSFGSLAPAQTPTFGSLTSAQAPSFGSSAPAQPPTFGSLAPAQAPSFGSSAPAQPPMFGSLSSAPGPTFGLLATSTPAPGMFGSVPGPMLGSPALSRPPAPSQQQAKPTTTTTTPSLGFPASAETLSKPAADKPSAKEPARPPTFSFSTAAKPAASQSQPPTVSTNQQQVVPSVVQSQAREEASVDDAVFVAAIGQEMAHFEAELAELKKSVGRMKIEIGAEADKGVLCRRVEAMAVFVKELKETTRAQNNEVSSLQVVVVETFAWIEEARSRIKQFESPRYQQLVRWRDLDPGTTRRLATIQHLVNYVESQLRQVMDVLDNQWLAFQDTCKDKTKSRLEPSMEVVYQTMVSQNNVANRQRVLLSSLVQRAQQLCSHRLNLVSNLSLACNDNKDESDLSRLAESLLQTKLGPSRPHKLSARKQAPLRSLLSDRAVTRVAPLRSKYVVSAILDLPPARQAPPPALKPPPPSSSTPIAANLTKPSFSFGSVIKPVKSASVPKKLSDYYEDITPPKSPEPKEESKAVAFGVGKPAEKNPLMSLDSVVISLNLDKEDKQKGAGLKETSTASKPCVFGGFSSNSTSTFTSSETSTTTKPSTFGGFSSNSASTFTSSETSTTTKPSTFGGFSSTSAPTFTATSSETSTTKPSVFGGFSSTSAPTFSFATGGLFGSSAAKTSEAVVTSDVAASKQKHEAVTTAPSSPKKALESETKEKISEPGFSFSLPSAATTQSSVFAGFSASAQPSKPSIFGGATTSSSTLFGGTTSAPTTSATTLFGGTTTSAPSLFGGSTATSASTTSAPSLFGGSTATSAPTLFGGTTSPAKPASIFGGSGSTTPSTLFGGQSSITPVESSSSPQSKASPGGLMYTINDASASPTKEAAGDSNTTVITINFPKASSASSTETPPPAFSFARPPTTQAQGSTSFFGQAVCSPDVVGSGDVKPAASFFGGASLFGGSGGITPLFGAAATSTSAVSPVVTVPASVSPLGVGAPVTSSVASPTLTSVASSVATTPVFGSSPASTASSSLFAAPSTTSPLFGAATPTTGPTTSLFGAATPTTTSTPSLFGAATPTTTSTPSMFGATPTASSPASSSLFGTATKPDAGLSDMFGSSSLLGTPSSTSAPPSAASIFGGGTSTGTPAASIFGGGTATSTPAASIFGGGTATSTPAASIFGGGTSTATSTPSMFGQTSSLSTPLFGQAAGFGASATASGGPLFGSGSAFGGGSTSVFGQATPSFGQATPSAASVFGATPSFGSAAPQPFGQSQPAASQSAFGGQSGTSFGQSGGALFGQSASNPSGGFGSGAGTSLFGGGNQTAFGGAATSANLFQSPGSSFGGGSFSSGQGQSISQTGFGASSSFGSKPGGFGAAPVFGGGGGFGSPPAFGASPAFGGAPAFGGSPNKLFGGNTAAPSGGFGSPTQQSSTFENLATQNTMTFGNLAHSQPQGFGSPQQQQQQQQTLFGSPQQNTQPASPPSFSGGGSFSSWR